jgi:hypothetical protein
MVGCTPANGSGTHESFGPNPEFPGSENGGVVAIFDNQTVRGRALRPRPFSLSGHLLGPPLAKILWPRSSLQYNIKRKAYGSWRQGTSFYGGPIEG